MRHDQIADKDSYRIVDVAAVWPVSPQMAPLPLSEIENAAAAPEFVPTPAAPDVPVAVGALIAGAYAMLLATFVLVTVSSAQSIFAVVIAAFFMLMFFAVPAIFFRAEGASKRPNFERFLAEGMDTLTGHSTAVAALVQMLIVPVSLTLGVTAIGIATAFIF